MKILPLGHCGLNCEECRVFIATVNNDNKLRQNIAEEWSELYAESLGDNGLKLADMNCKGCHSESSLFIGCENCSIRKCCKEKKVATCASCDRFEKCDMLNGFLTVPSHQCAKDNLNKIRMNLEKRP